MMMTMVTAIRTTMMSTMTTTMTMMMIDLWQCYLYTFSHDTADGTAESTGITLFVQMLD